MSDLSLEDLGKIAERKLENKYLLILVAILAVASLLRFKYAFFPGLWLDEANMARMAVDVSQHPLQYMTEWRGQLTKRPPVFIYSMAFSKSLLGGMLGTETAIKIVNPIAGTLTVLGVYLLGREMYSKKIGLVAAALLAVNPLSWFLSERVLIGTFLTLIFVTVIGVTYYAFENRRYSKYALWSLGPLLAVAILTKQPAYTLGLIVPMYLLYKKRDNLKDYLLTDKNFKQSELFDVLGNTDYYISASLGTALLLPWFIRNMSVCEFPLCGIMNSLSFVSKDVTRATASVQSSFYFIFALGSILTIPVLVFLILRLVSYLYENSISDGDLMVKKLVSVFLLSTFVYIVDQRFLPMLLLSSVSIFAKRDCEKLLWLWAGVGIGFMSVPEIKVPRYIVFTIPALILLSSKSISDFSTRMESVIPNTEFLEKEVLGKLILLILVLPIVIFSFNQGLSMVSGSGSPGMSESGEWLRNNLNQNQSFASSSPQMKFYARPYVEVKSAGSLPENSTAFRKFAAEQNLTYLVVDIYERTQPEWLQLEVPPYRLNANTLSRLRQNAVQPEEIVGRFRKNHSFLIPVARFGRTNVPLTRSNQQPRVIIYRINQTALR